MSRGVAPTVVVTGLGTVGSLGLGASAVGAALAAGEPRLTAVDRSPAHPAHPCAALASLAADQDLTRWLTPSTARRMSPPSRYAVAAARMALEDAGLTALDPGAAVVVAAGFGAVSFSERLYRSIVDDGPETASPFLFTESVASAPASQIAIQCGATGPNVTVVQREAGSLVALARGWTEITEGRGTQVLVGAVDEVTPLVHGVLDSFDALARPCGGRPERARPFDRNRNGMTLAEGATVLVLEDESVARARGARILARVLAVGGGFDPSATRAGWGRGEAVLARGVARTLERAGLTPSDVDLVVSGANGAVAGDRIEGRMIRCLWSDSGPAAVAPKGVTGEYGGGFLAAAVVAARGGEFAQAVGFDVDPDIGLTPFAGGTLPASRCALVTSLAAGGAAGWALLEGA